MSGSFFVENFWKYFVTNYVEDGYIYESDAGDSKAATYLLFSI